MLNYQPVGVGAKHVVPVHARGSLHCWVERTLEDAPIVHPREGHVYLSGAAEGAVVRRHDGSAPFEIGGGRRQCARQAIDRTQRHGSDCSGERTPGALTMPNPERGDQFQVRCTETPGQTQECHRERTA